MDLGPFQELAWPENNALARDAIGTVVLVATAFGLRAVLLRRVRRTSWADESTRARWRMQVRHSILAVSALGLFLIWGSELRTLALSLVAVAVALVIATKELILCLMGSILRASSRSFTVGDRIEINGVRGDVIDAGIFATQILETGPAHHRTGRVIVLPNSLFLTVPVINETFSEHELLLHVVTVPLQLDDDWERAETALLEAARRVTETYQDAARVSLTSAAKNHHLDDAEMSTTTEPRVLLHLPEAGQLSLSVRVPTPVREKGTVEQEILRRYLELMTASRRERPTSDFRELGS